MNTERERIVLLVLLTLIEEPATVSPIERSQIWTFLAQRKAEIVLMWPFMIRWVVGGYWVVVCRQPPRPSQQTQEMRVKCLCVWLWCLRWCEMMITEPLQVRWSRSPQTFIFLHKTLLCLVSSLLLGCWVMVNTELFCKIVSCVSSFERSSLWVKVCRS